MSEEEPVVPPIDDTSNRNPILKRKFGDNWRTWSWVAKATSQFSWTSVTVICSLLCAAGGYWLHSRAELTTFENQLAILQMAVKRVNDDEKRITDVQIELGEHAVELTGHGGRIQRLEDNYDYAQIEAGSPPVSRRTRKR